MQLTKYAHACVALTSGGRTIVLDPGSLTPGAREAVAGAGAVLVTHEHFDHVDEQMLRVALGEQPELRVFAPAGVRERLGHHDGRVTAVAAGDALEVAGFSIGVFGELHAPIHADIPRVANVGYLVDGAVYHPGDSYYAPGVPVGTLLLPTSGPWTKLGEGADFVRAVRPERVVQIHELMLSDLGQNSAAMLLGENGLTGLPLERPAPGETIDI
jgi:L-ascorbate metabolism protein UlaG (beta-lactamase superfamily)